MSPPLDETGAPIFDRLAGAGIVLDRNGDIHDSSGFPSKRQSTPGIRQRHSFTEDDDRILHEWISRAELQGLHVKPKIFDDLEKTAPRHTAGSWRARWLKMREGMESTKGVQSTKGGFITAGGCGKDVSGVACDKIPARDGPIPEAVEREGERKGTEGDTVEKGDALTCAEGGLKPTEVGLKPTEVGLKPTEIGLKPTEVGHHDQLTNTEIDDDWLERFLQDNAWDNIAPCDNTLWSDINQSGQPKAGIETSEPLNTALADKDDETQHPAGISDYRETSDLAGIQYPSELQIPQASDVAEIQYPSELQTQPRAPDLARDAWETTYLPELQILPPYTPDPGIPGSQLKTTPRANWTIPPVPTYAPVESRAEPGQIRAWDWMALSGRRRFMAQEELLLSRWGVKPTHRGTCVLVPLLWASSDPAALLPGFDYTAFKGLSEARLTFSMCDHTTSWARAASWFWSNPHSGLEFDNFLGSGPFQPKEGSHRCHQPFCVNPNHVTYEDMGTNAKRNHCCGLGRHLREQGYPVPTTCTKHNPPCLLQHASMTAFECLLIQLSIVAGARGLDPPSVCAPPDHPYPTFESRLPISLPGSSLALYADDMADGAAGGEPAIERPVFRCPFCPVIKPFVSLLAFWGHIRDRHQLVAPAVRLEEVVCSGRTWLDHDGAKTARRASDHALLRLAQQTQEEDFTWEVVQGWKLAAQKRKFSEQE